LASVFFSYDFGPISLLVYFLTDWKVAFHLVLFACWIIIFLLDFLGHCVVNETRASTFSSIKLFVNSVTRIVGVLTHSILFSVLLQL